LCGQLEKVHDRRLLAGHEEAPRQDMKLKSLGLSPLQRTITGQESHLLWLSEGDASFIFFHAHVYDQWRIRSICSLEQNGQHSLSPMPFLLDIEVLHDLIWKAGS
jgi:hypothetical protein